MAEADAFQEDICDLQLEKADKRVRYRGAAADATQTCGNCRFYEPSELECSLIEGTITPVYVCDLWSEQLPLPTPIPMPAEMMPDSDMGMSSYDPEHGYGWSEEPFRVFVATAFAEDLTKPQWIPFLPKPGVYQHPRYGDVVITPETNAAYVQSVKDCVYQDNIPLDAEHQTKLSGAVAWLKDMRMNSDHSSDALVEWTQRGRTLLAGGQFKYVSAELWDEWTDPASGTVHQHVVGGGAITTRPFFKDKVLRALVASETGVEVRVAKFRDFSPDERATMAKSGVAMPDGEYPIPDADALDRAIKSIGRATDRAAVMAHIKKRATALGKTSALPKEWSEKEIKVADGTEPKTYTADEVDGKIQKAVKEATEATSATFTEQVGKLTTDLEAAQTLVASEKTAREGLATQLGTIKAKDLNRHFVEVVSGKGGATDGATWVGDAEKHVVFLEKLAEQFGEDSEVLKDYIEQQASIATTMAESDTFKTMGSGRVGAGISDPDAKLEQMAHAAVAADTTGKTQYAEAYDRILRTPEGIRLYAESNDKLGNKK